MKNYATNSVDAKTFIIKYKEKDKFLKIKYAKGKSFKVPNTEENKIKIQDKMKEQINLSFGKESDYDKYLEKSNIVWFVYDYIVGLYNIMGLNRGTTDYLVLSVVAALVFGLLGSVRMSGFIYGKILKSDIEKNQLFVSEEDNINKALRENRIILQNLSKKVKNIICSAYYESPTLDINKVDKISLKELKTILRSIKEIQQYDGEIVAQGLYQNPEIEELMKKYDDKEEDNKEASKELGYHLLEGPTEG